MMVLAGNISAPLKALDNSMGRPLTRRRLSLFHVEQAINYPLLYQLS